MWRFNKGKFIEALLFLALNTKHFGITKAVKLLFLADVEHFRRYGRPLIGDEYRPEKYGPLSIHAFNILASNRDGEANDLEGTVKFRSGIVWQHTRDEIVPIRREVDKNIFSESDLEILSEIAAEYKEKEAEEIKREIYKSELWGEIIKKGEFEYLDALKESDDRSISREYIESILAEEKEFSKLFVENGIQR